MADAAQLVGGLANVERTNSNAVVSHYNVQPVIDIFATPQGRDLGALASDIQRVIHATAPDLYECYVTGPHSSPDPAEWRTEFTRPLLA